MEPGSLANGCFFVRGDPDVCSKYTVCVCARRQSIAAFFKSGMAQFMDDPVVRAAETDPVSCCFVTLEISNRRSLPGRT